MAHNFTFSKSFDLKCDPDGRYAEDRKEQPVRIYKLSDEELAKYRTEPYKKPSMANICNLKRKGNKDMQNDKAPISGSVLKGEHEQKTENGHVGDPAKETIVEYQKAKKPEQNNVKRLSKKLIAKEYSSGLTAKEIAHKYNKAEFWVYGELVKLGLEQKVSKYTSSKSKENHKQEIETIHGIHDSGAREDFGTGAKRDTQEGKGRFDLITPVGLFRLARWYELGAKKYSERNWEKGIPVSRCVSSAFRHLAKYLAGYKDEDHLAAVVWNVFAIMHFERYRPDLRDLDNIDWRKKEFDGQEWD